MRNITLTLPDYAAEAYEGFSDADKAKTAFLVESFTHPLNEIEFSQTLKNIGNQVRENGMTEQEIETFLNELS